jgi:soluble lytic murein transglycosylase-like protein
MIVGCVFLIFFASLLTDPNRLMALASSQALTAAGALSAGAGAGHLVEVSESQPEPTALPTPTESAAPVQEEASTSANEQGTPAEDSGCAISSAYPEKIQRWCEQITHESKEHSVDANLIAAVMLQESGGNPEAYSKSGAVGLMQVMPRDGLAANFQCKNGPCFASRPSMEELYDPAFNVDYGARMLAGLIERHGGDFREALRAYGPMDMGYRYADIVLGHYNRYQ